MAQTDGDGEFVGRVQIDQRADKFVPMLDEGKDGDGGNGWFGKRQQDVPEDAYRRCAIEFGSFIQVARDGGEELTQQEDVERTPTKKGGDDQRQVGVDPTQIAEEQEGWHNGDLPR